MLDYILARQREYDRSKGRALSTEQRQQEQQHNTITGTTEVVTWRGKIQIFEKQHLKY